MAEKRQTISREDILTPEEAAKILKVSTDTVYAACDAGKLPYRKIGNRRRIPGWLIIDWLDSCKPVGNS